MNFTATDQVLIIVAIAAVLAFIAFAFLYLQKRRATTAGLRERFGSEYDRAIEKHGSERKGQERLRDREKRVEKLNIRELTPQERDRYLERWNAMQSRFVDSPTGAVAEADELVSTVMRTRGYPVSDFEQRAADISVDHPQVTENYRAAHTVALRLGKSETTTEDLRIAMTSFHALFDELVEVRVVDAKAAA